MLKKREEIHSLWRKGMHQRTNEGKNVRGEKLKKKEGVRTTEAHSHLGTKLTVPMFECGEGKGGRWVTDQSRNETKKTEKNL